MINLVEIIHDPDFSTTFKVIRKSAVRYERGRQITEEKEYKVKGFVAPIYSRDLELMPEADRVHGLKTFYTDAKFPLHITDTKATSDICVYKGQRYKLINVFDYSANGFWKAIGTLLGEEDDV